MQITPTNFYTKNYIPKFTGSEYTHKEDRTISQSELAHEKDNAYFVGAVLGVATCIIAAGIGSCIAGGVGAQEQDEFLEKVQTICNSKDIKKDTFKVEDITEDNKADLILYKKDGSKVVIDIANQRILKETSKLDVIQ